MQHSVLYNIFTTCVTSDNDLIKLGFVAMGIDTSIMGQGGVTRDYSAISPHPSPRCEVRLSGQEWRHSDPKSRYQFIFYRDAIKHTSKLMEI